MLLAALLLQTSWLLQPLHLSPEPPELRTLEHIVFLHTDVPEVPPSVTISKAQALEAAQSVMQALGAGADFHELARARSMARTARSGGVLGTFPSGILEPELDAFLFQAEVGEISAPIDAASGVHVLRRVPTYCGVRQIFLRGRDEAVRARAEALLARLRAGEDFAELARTCSEDPASARAGGDYSIFERGADDKLLKKAAFEAELGELLGPIESARGFHILQRVTPETLDPALTESTQIRVRAILVGYHGAFGASPSVTRTAAQAVALADELRERILAGEDMAELARQYDDDRTGRERAGDLGWIHRFVPGLAPYIQAAFLLPIGGISEPRRTGAGFVLVRRER